MRLSLEVNFDDALMRKLALELGLEEKMIDPELPAEENTLEEVEDFLESDMERLLIQNYSEVLDRIYIREADLKHKNKMAAISATIKTQMAAAITHSVGD